MASKEARHALIIRLVRGNIGTQAELLRALRARGPRVTQSTLSRDLVELNLRKIAGRYRQAPAERPTGSPAPSDLAAAVKRFTTCGPHLTVIATVVGQAQPVAVAIDAAAEPAVTATLAGDDTVFVATKSRRAQTVLLRRLTHWFGDKHEP